jgi:hypothetical protein
MSMYVGPFGSEPDFTHASFREFRLALAGAFPDISEADADNAMMNLWARIMMARFGVSL